MKNWFTQTAAFLLLLLLIVTGACAQENDSALPGAKDYRQDFTVFRNTLQQQYPSLYRFTGRKKMDALLDSCYNSIDENTAPVDFYRLIKFAVSAIGDGHLACRPSPELKKYLDEEALLFPLNIHFIGDKAYMRYPVGDNIIAGTEVIAINEEPVNQVRQKLFRYIVADGAVQSKKYVILDNVFRFYYAMVYGEQNVFKIAFRTAAGDTVTRKIHGISAKDLGMPDEPAPAKLLDLLFTKDNIAVLTIKSFSKQELDEKGTDFPAFLDSAFRVINNNKVNRLIIDVRGNGGGRDSYGILLYSYLANKAFRYYNSLKTATTVLPYEDFDSTVSSYNHLTGAMLKKTSGEQFKLTEEAHPGLTKIQPHENKYQGALWVLTDGLSFSTTAEFCAVARSHKRAVFIGEETGGTYCGNTSGAQVETVLPASKLVISLGTVQYNMAVKKKRPVNRGVIPDHSITPTMEDVVKSNDSILEYALQLIHHKAGSR